MSYNTYWCGSLEVKPPLTPAEVEKLEDWLGHNDDQRIITDPEVIEHLTMEDWIYHTPWSPVEAFLERQDLYPGVSSIEIESQAGYPDIMSILIHHLIKQIEGHTVNGSASWDGDESDDIGEIVVRDGEVFLCNGSVVYEEPSEENKVTFA